MPLTYLNLFIVMVKFAMVQPWTIGVWRIDLMFVTELAVVMLFVYSRLYKNSI